MTTQTALPILPTKYLDRPGGRIAYDVDGSGPLVVMVPGMGDLRGAYRFLAPALRASGYRVACTDLRGHGDSDASFSSYGDEPTASDLVALIEHLAESAVVIGNSMSAGAAVIAATDRPDLVGGLVLVGPFVRTPKSGVLQRLLLRVAMKPLWAATTWKSYLPKLYKGQRPEDFDAYLKLVVASIRRPGYAKSFSLTTRTRHDVAESHLGDVSAPALVVMGELDPDFPNPEAEAEWIAKALPIADVAMVADAGHYPQSQQPAAVIEAVTAFLDRVMPHA